MTQILKLKMNKHTHDLKSKLHRNDIDEFENRLSNLSIENKSKNDDLDEIRIDNEYNSDSFSTEEVRSETPSDYNEHDHIFHFNFINNFPSAPHRYKNGTRKSYTFSNEKMREIERTNRILLKKILTNGPNYVASRKKTQTNSYNQRTSSAEVNRRKQQRQIDLDNQVLQKKIEKTARRKSLV